MKPYRSAANAETTSAINISPLIDVVFILLIFFVVTTVFVDEAGLAIRTPEASPPTEDAEPTIIEVSRELAIRLDGVVVPLEALAGLISRQNRLDEPTISIKVADAVPTAVLVDVMDACAAGGAGEISVRILD